jgi:hypothetical protein
VALCQARTSTKPLWGLSSSNPYHPSHVPNSVKRKKYKLGFYNRLQMETKRSHHNIQLEPYGDPNRRPG